MELNASLLRVQLFILCIEHCHAWALLKNIRKFSFRNVKDTHLDELMKNDTSAYIALYTLNINGHQGASCYIP